MSPPDSDDFGTLFPSSESRAEESQSGGLAGADGGRLPNETSADKDTKGPSPPEQPILDHPTTASRVLLSQDNLKRHLVELSLITEADWESASKAVGDDADCLSILHQLGQMPASWQAGTDDRFTALTSFQIQQILAGFAERLRLQHYVVLDRLGAGGMGEVFSARNLNLPRVEAIKTILPEQAAPGDTEASTGLGRFEQEARVLAQLNHRYITTIHHAGQDHGVNFIAMEYVHGQDMKEIVEQTMAEGDSVPIWWAAERAIAICEALQHAHENGVIHRDVKPGNIMITDENELKVLDMGIARLFSSDGDKAPVARLTQSATGLGTPEVMPPEQWADATAVTPASDIYSLGCTFFYMLTGRMPFEADSVNGLMFAHVNDPPPRVSDLRFDASQELDDIVARMLEKEPTDRFHSCEELIEELLPLTDPSTAAPSGRRLKGLGGLKWLAAGLLGAAAVVAGATLAPVLFRPDFEAQARDWLVEYQQANSTVWTDIETLERFRESDQDLKRIDSQQGFDRLKAKVIDRTDSLQRVPQEADAWLGQHQAMNQAVWSSRGKLDTFVEQTVQMPARDPESFQALKEQVEKETQRRGALHEQVRSYLKSYQEDHSSVWKSLKDIEGFAFQSLPLAEITTQADFKALQKRLEQREQELMQSNFREVVDKRLAEYQQKHRQVWTSLPRLRDFANDLMTLESITDEKSLQELIERIDRATFNDQAQQWVDDFRKGHQCVWPTTGDLNGFIDKQVGKVHDQASYEKMVETVRSETEKLINKKVEEAIEERQAKHPELWSTTLSLREDLATVASTKTIIDDKTYDLFASRLNELTAAVESPFDGIRLVAVDDPVRHYSAAVHLHMYEWLLRLDPAKEDAENDLQFEIRTDPERPAPAQGVCTVATGEPIHLFVKSRKGGYLTLLSYGCTGARFMFQWEQPVPPNEELKLVMIGAQEEPGVDIALLYLTSVDPLESCPPKPTASGAEAEAGEVLAGPAVSAPRDCRRRETGSRFQVSAVGRAS